MVESKLLPAGALWSLVGGGVKVANREIDGFMRPANASRDHLRVQDGSGSRVTSRLERV